MAFLITNFHDAVLNYLIAFNSFIIYWNLDFIIFLYILSLISFIICSKKVIGEIIIINTSLKSYKFSDEIFNVYTLAYSSVILLIIFLSGFGFIECLIVLPLLGIIIVLALKRDSTQEFYTFIVLYVLVCILSMPNFSIFYLDSTNVYLFGYDNIKEYIIFNPVRSENQGAFIVSSYPSISWIISLAFLLDSFSYLFIFLNVILTCLCIIILIPTWSFDPLFKLYIILLFGISFILNLVFLAFDLWTFCISFEFILLPMVCLIGLWGSLNRRQANNYLIFFTILGAVPILIGLLYTWMQCINMLDLSFFSLRLWNWAWEEQVCLFLIFLIPFAIKTPMVPVHIWLPKAHVDAPTSGSVILAGLLLKIGFFGFIRFLLPVFAIVSYDLLPCVASAATLGVIYSSFVNLRQMDLKRIIAYSSVAHINIALVSLCLYDCLGGTAAIFVMFSHGFISSAIFFLIGFLYHRFHQRLINYYGGLSTLMPIFTIFLFLFSLANMSFPFTAGFIGEFLCLFSMFEVNIILGFLNSSTIFLTTAYTILLFSRICFGMLKGSLSNIMQSYLNSSSTKMHGNIDLIRFETFILVVLLFFTVLFGIYPSLIFQSMWFSLSSIYNFDVVNLSFLFGVTFTQFKDRLHAFVDKLRIFHVCIFFLLFFLWLYSIYSRFLNLEYYIISLFLLSFGIPVYLTYYFFDVLNITQIINFRSNNILYVPNFYRRWVSTFPKSQENNDQAPWYNKAALNGIYITLFLLFGNLFFVFKMCNVSMIKISSHNASIKGLIETFGGVNFCVIFILCFVTIMGLLCQYLSFVSPKHKTMFFGLSLFVWVCFGGGTISLLSNLHSFTGIDSQGHFTTLVVVGKYFSLSYSLPAATWFDNILNFWAKNQNIINLLVVNKTLVLDYLALGKISHANSCVDFLMESLLPRVKVSDKAGWWLLLSQFLDLTTQITSSLEWRRYNSVLDLSSGIWRGFTVLNWCVGTVTYCGRGVSSMYDWVYPETPIAPVVVPNTGSLLRLEYHPES